MEFKSWGHAPTGRRVLSETQGFVTALHSRTQLSQWAGQSGGSEATGLLAILVPAGTSCFVRRSPELCRSCREGGTRGESTCASVSCPSLPSPFMSWPQSLHHRGAAFLRLFKGCSLVGLPPSPPLRREPDAQALMLGLPVATHSGLWGPCTVRAQLASQLIFTPMPSAPNAPLRLNFPEKGGFH